MPNKSQIGGVVRTILAVTAGYLKGRGVDILPLLDPTVIDAIAGLIFVGVTAWSLKAKGKEVENASPTAEK